MSQGIYDYLLKNAIGYENRIKGRQLMSVFNINDHKTLRSYIEEARDNKDFKYFIASESGKDGGYWIATSSQDRNATTSSLTLRARKMLDTAKKQRRKKIYERTKD